LHSESDTIRTDPYGVLRVANTRISLDSVVTGYLQGHSATTIQQQYPGLTLVQVERVIEYYLQHRAEVDEYLRRQEEQWRQLRAEAEKNSSPVVERLRALRMSEAQP
jgi:uncharacterized protein (DUF433 family)